MYQLETITVTPEMVQEWLGTQPKHQRKINNAYVKRLAEAMRSGTFNQSPQPFLIDTNGDLLDGQHRASAVALSGVPLESSVVVRGVDPEMFAKIDIGMKRNAGQFIQSRYGSLIAAATRFIIAYHTNDQMPDLPRLLSSIPIDEVVAQAEQETWLDLLAGQAGLIASNTHISGPTLLAVTALAAGTEADRIEDWLTGLNTGANLEVGDPRLTLRNTFSTNYKVLNRGHERRRQWAYVVKAWNAYALEEPLRALRFRANPNDGRSADTMPRIYGS